jgi:3-dehydroquinate dehydratase/shikimate dehydrogenase
VAELRAVVERAAREADLVELRFDCLEEGAAEAALPELRQLAGVVGRPFIYTFRPTEEGGYRALGVPERAAFWRAVAAERRGPDDPPAFADLELSLLESAHGRTLVEALSATGARGGLKVICSYHDFESVPRDLGEIYERMKRTGAAVFKIAALAQDAADCAPLLGLLERARGEGRELIALGMGAPGVWTRVLGPSRGAFLTFGSLDADSATAPGQLSVRELLELYRVRRLSERTIVTGLVGRPVGHSLSPHMHNAAIAASGLDGVYLPFEVADLESFVKRLARPRTRELDWQLRGFSVTAPHKAAMLPLLDSVERRAREIGAINTVVIEGEELHGYNTDAAAALLPLEALMALGKARVALAGAGGAARAVLWGLRERGARAVVFARDEAKGAALASEFGAEAASLSGARLDGFDLVVNATPLGTSGRLATETPFTAEQLRGARVAYDLVYNPAETRFLREARTAGCRTLGGLSMLVAQAAEQFTLWTGLQAPADVMRAAAEERLAVKES